MKSLPLLTLFAVSLLTETSSALWPPFYYDYEMKGTIFSYDNITGELSPHHQTTVSQIFSSTFNFFYVHTQTQLDLTTSLTDLYSLANHTSNRLIQSVNGVCENLPNPMQIGSLKSQVASFNNESAGLVTY